MFDIFRVTSLVAKKNVIDLGVSSTPTIRSLIYSLGFGSNLKESKNRDV
jgi:hypothetical protein